MGKHLATNPSCNFACAPPPHAPHISPPASRACAPPVTVRGVRPAPTPPLLSNIVLVVESVWKDVLRRRYCAEGARPGRPGDGQDVHHQAVRSSAPLAPSGDGIAAQTRERGRRRHLSAARIWAALRPATTGPASRAVRADPGRADSPTAPGCVRAQLRAAAGRHASGAAAAGSSDKCRAESPPHPSPPPPLPRCSHSPPRPHPRHPASPIASLAGRSPTASATSTSLPSAWTSTSASSR